LFGQLSGYVSPTLQSAVQDELRAEGMDVFRSPSAAAAQLSYLYELHCCHAVFGGLELLLYGVEEVICSMNFTRGTYEVVRLQDVLDDLVLDFKAFLDACLLSGFDVCRTFPPLLNTTICKKFSFQAAVDIIMKYHTAEDAIFQLREHFLLHLDSVLQHMIGEDPSEMDEWEKYKVQLVRVRQRLLHPKVLTIGGLARTLGKPDFEETNIKFPNALYHLLSKGVISTFPCDIITAKNVIDTAPIIDSQEYMQCMECQTCYRNRFVDVLSQILDKTLQTRPVSVWRYFLPNRQLYLKHDPVFLKFWLDTMQRSAYLSSHLNEPVELITPCHMFLKFQDSLSNFSSLQERKDPTQNPNLAQYYNGEEVRFLAFTGLLTILGFLTNEGPTEVAEALLDLDEFQEETILFIELLRQGCFKFSPMNIIDAEGAASQNSKDVELGDVRRLIARVCLLLPIHTDHKPWTGHVHRGLSAFSCVITAFQRSLRNSLDSILVWLAVCSKKSIPLSVMGDLSQTLPYRRERSSGCAVFVSKLLRGASIEDLQEIFPEVDDPKATLQRAHRFFKQIVRIVENLSSQPFISSTDFLQVFREAEELFDKCVEDRL